MLTGPLAPLILLTLFKNQYLFAALLLLMVVLFVGMLCRLMFLRGVGDVIDEPGVMTEGRELITVGGTAILMAALLLACFFMPYRYLALVVVYAGLASGVVRLELVESVPMALVFPTGVPFLLRYVNLVNGARGSLP